MELKSEYRLNGKDKLYQRQGEWYGLEDTILMLKSVYDSSTSHSYAVTMTLACSGVSLPSRYHPRRFRILISGGLVPYNLEL